MRGWGMWHLLSAQLHAMFQTGLPEGNRPLGREYNFVMYLKDKRGCKMDPSSQNTVCWRICMKTIMKLGDVLV
jgi:hypothetical protein